MLNELRSCVGQLLEELAILDESDESFLQAVLEDPLAVSEELIHGKIRQGVVSGKLNPVLCGSAFKNKGIQPLLDAIVKWLPSPLDRGEIESLDKKSGQTISLTPGDESPLAALTFKIMTDPYVGRLTFVRLYAGVLRKGMPLFNRDEGKERTRRTSVGNACRRESG